jgi:hypothetical protein
MRQATLTMVIGTLSLVQIGTIDLATAQKEQFKRSKPHVNVQARTLQAIPPQVRRSIETDGALVGRQATSASILDTLDEGCGEGNWIASWVEDENGDLVPGTFDYECVENP